MKQEFERVQPQMVNISNDAIWNLLNRLEHDKTQMHGLMIMKDGKICAEGWWSPFAPGIIHGNQSLTKTYAAAAIGIAVTKKMLSLSDRIIDFFPEEAAEGEIRNLRVKDVLSMSCGMEEMPQASEHWIRDFLATRIEHSPGTEFFYNSVGSNLLAAIIKKVSNLELVEFLQKELFPLIGINDDEFICYNLPDGTAAGGGGSYATLESNLRLMKLYADKGCCNGVRILSEEYVKLATTKQVDTNRRQDYDVAIRNSNCGYGYQIWMCDEENTYRADGAYGQFAIVNTDLNMIIAIHEVADLKEQGPEITLQAVMQFIREVKQGIPEKQKISMGLLNKRLDTLCIPHPVESKVKYSKDTIVNKRYLLRSGEFDLERNVLPLIIGSKPTCGVTEFFYVKRGAA